MKRRERSNWLCGVAVQYLSWSHHCWLSFFVVWLERWVAGLLHWKAVLKVSLGKREVFTPVNALSDNSFGPTMAVLHSVHVHKNLQLQHAH